MFQSLSFPSNLTLANSSTSSAFLCRAAVAPPPPKQAAPPLRKRNPGSLYEVLRVKHNASKLEIKSAYRSLAKIYHPDVTPSSSSSSLESDGCDFLQIHSAYETLSDPAARAVYDLSLGLILGSNTRFNAASFRGYSSGRRRSTRRWETDQCW